MNYHDKVSKHIVRADNIIKEFIYSLSPLYKKEFGDRQETLVSLFSSLHSTSESILVLLLNQAIFDADILLRTIMEGTIKYCYLMIGDEDEKYKKYEEYYNNLPDIDLLDDHKKAVEAVEILKKYSKNNTFPFELSILKDEEVDRLRRKYPSKIRNEMKQKWSYQNILRNLANTHEEYKAQLGSLITYSLSSHLIHYDWTGESMRQAQILNSPFESEVIWDIAHAIRIISNVLSFYVFRVIEYLRGNQYCCDIATNLIKSTLDYINDLIEIGNSIIDNNCKTM